MKYGSDNEFFDRCRKVDFSAESTDYEQNLERLKNKLTNEERPVVTKIKKIPIAVAAALAIVLSLSVVALATTAWRQLDTRVVQGEEYVQSLIVKESEDGTYQIWAMEIDPDASGVIVAVVDGEEFVLRDAHDYDDLDAALARLAATLGSIKMPAYFPEGFTFEQATYHANVSALNIIYSFGEQTLRLRIGHYPEEWGIPQWSPTFEEVEINGFNGKLGGGSLWLQIGDVAYEFDGFLADLDYDHLIKIAASLA